ncbi:DegT/DnrJ/EryC1/StrS family aminotransferase [Haloarchaeobius baliensis]|uniref:DegT/DnrJ/EryC1/StrS family aminotransferase n=1 Tax=Haloarchaeobius baliensis TaxID=1670458 RepID=UPI003F885792
MEVPLCDPDIRDAEVDAVEEVLRSGWLAHGPKNDEFEEAFAEYVGAEHAVSLNSCTSALHLAVEANDITGEVILPSFTWVASANAIVTGGAEPVFVDIDRETRNIDPEAVEEAITDETEAIMVVHYGGLACDMDRIMAIADEHDLHVIEDSAETIGGTYDGQVAGTFATGCYSFYPTKNITTAEGGVLTTDDEELAEEVRTLLGHGVPSTTFDREDADKSWFRAATKAGYNFRMSNVHAALGVEQMERLDEMNEARREHAAYFDEALADVDGIETPTVPDGREHVYQMYTVLTGDGIDRGELLDRMNDAGVGASAHFYPPVHEQPRYEGAEYQRHDLSTTEQVARDIVTLPMYPTMTAEEREYVVDTLVETVDDLR